MFGACQATALKKSEEGPVTGGRQDLEDDQMEAVLAREQDKIQRSKEGHSHPFPGQKSV